VNAEALIEAAPRRIWADERGSMTFIRVPPRVGIIVFAGRVGDGGVLAWELHFPWLLSDEMCLFCDAAEVSRPSALVTATGASLIGQSRQRISEFHVLVRSGVNEVIAKTVNMSIGGFMRLHREREVFERERDRVLAQSGTMMKSSKQ
jgi:hypothetical protein